MFRIWAKVIWEIVTRYLHTNPDTNPLNPFKGIPTFAPKKAKSVNLQVQAYEGPERCRDDWKHHKLRNSRHETNEHGLGPTTSRLLTENLGVTGTH